MWVLRVFTSLFSPFQDLVVFLLKLCTMTQVQYEHFNMNNSSVCSILILPVLKKRLVNLLPYQHEFLLLLAYEWILYFVFYQFQFQMCKTDLAAD